MYFPVLYIKGSMMNTQANEQDALIKALKMEVSDLKAYVALAARQTGLLQDTLERIVKDTNAAIKGITDSVVVVQRTCEQDRKQFVALQMQLEEDRRKRKEAYEEIAARFDKNESMIKQERKATLEEIQSVYAKLNLDK